MNREPRVCPPTQCRCYRLTEGDGNDTGGAIFGAHFDLFVGTRALRKQVKLPEFGQVWFAGIEQRIPPGYTYGLEA